MAISGNASYLPTTQDFCDHWAQADAALVPAPGITMPGGPLGWPTEVNASTLNGLLSALEIETTNIQSKINGLELARGTSVTQQSELLDLLGQFTDKVRGNLSGTKWIDALPLLPSIGDAQSRFCDPLDDAQDLWLRINVEQVLGVGVVLVLRNGVTQAQFATKVAALKVTWRSVGQAELALKLARGHRNQIQGRIYPILKQYRVVLPTYFAPDSPIVASLPRLTPEPGATPTPAVLTGVWNAGTAKADLNAAIPVQVGMKTARLMYAPGSVWNDEDATTVESRNLVGVNLAVPVVFHTDFALSAPGSHALFRVVLVSETDNEASSNVLELTRP